MTPKGVGQASLSLSAVDTLFTSVAVDVLGLFSAVALARILGPVGRGEFGLFVAIGSTVTLFTGFSLATGITYFVARGTELASLTGRMIVFLVVQGLLASLILVALWNVGLLAPRLTSVAPITSFALLVGFVVLSSAAALWRATLIGRRQIIRANRRYLTAAVLGVSASLTVLLAWRSSSPRFVLTALYVIAVVVSGITAFLFVLAARAPAPGLLSDRRTGGLEDRPALGRVLRFSLPAYLGDVLQLANYRLDLLFVSYYVGATQLGIYSLAVAAAHIVWFVPRAVATVILPGTAFEQNEVERSGARAAQGARMALWGSIGVCCLLATTGRFLLPLVFGAGFRESYDMLLALLPGVALFGLVVVLASYVIGMGKPRLNLYVSAAAFAVTLGLDLRLIPPFGGMGAAVASSASYSTSAILTIVVFHRLSGVSVAEALLPRRGDMDRGMSALRSALPSRGRVV